MGNVTLNWTVTDGPLGSWYVIATHPRALQEVADSLGCPDHDPGCGPVGTYDSVGSADGTRISRHLRSWAERAELVAAPGEHDAFRETVALLAKGAEGVDRCCWKLARPAPRQMQLEVRLELAPRRSADHP